jgi:hypothetical protein
MHFSFSDYDDNAGTTKEEFEARKQAGKQR